MQILTFLWLKKAKKRKLSTRAMWRQDLSVIILFESSGIFFLVPLFSLFFPKTCFSFRVLKNQIMFSLWIFLREKLSFFMYVAKMRWGFFLPTSWEGHVLEFHRGRSRRFRTEDTDLCSMLLIRGREKLQYHYVWNKTLENSGFFKISLVVLGKNNQKNIFVWKNDA